MNRIVSVCAILVFFSAVPALAQSVVFDQGPTTGTGGEAPWSNNTLGQHFADRVTFPTTTAVTAIVIFASIEPASGTVHVKILADSGGVPGSVLYSEDKTPNSWVVDAASGGYKIRVVLTTPFVAQAGSTYWYGVSGNNDLSEGLTQYSVLSPGDGQMAQFRGADYLRMATVGDQMFQLEGAAPVPAIPSWGLSLLGLLLAGLGVVALRGRRGAAIPR